MKFLLSGLLMITCLTVFGQVEKKTTFGFKGGLNQSYINGSMINGDKSGYTGLELYTGFFADTRLSEKWHIENEILFSYTDSYHFVETPLHLKYEISPKINVFFGPKLDFLIGNTSDYNNEISKFYSISGEIGTQFKINKRFFIELRYSKSFTKQFDIIDFNNGKRNTLRLGLGINF
ncbi:MAG: PorT family protein [Flavobacteriaceae bacterium]|nr:PorT family protein [Flavobacteriaceae bacterium]